MIKYRIIFIIAFALFIYIGFNLGRASADCEKISNGIASPCRTIQTDSISVERFDFDVESNLENYSCVESFSFSGNFKKLSDEINSGRVKVFDRFDSSNIRFYDGKELIEEFSFSDVEINDTQLKIYNRAVSYVDLHSTNIIYSEAVIWSDNKILLILSISEKIAIGAGRQKEYVYHYLSPKLPNAVQLSNYGLEWQSCYNEITIEKSRQTNNQIKISAQQAILVKIEIAQQEVDFYTIEIAKYETSITEITQLISEATLLYQNVIESRRRLVELQKQYGDVLADFYSTHEAAYDEFDRWAREEYKLIDSNIATIKEKQESLNTIKNNLNALQSDTQIKLDNAMQELSEIEDE